MLIKIGKTFEFEHKGSTFIKFGKFHIHMTRSNLFDWKPVVQRDPKRSSWDVWFLNRQAVVDWA